MSERQLESEEARPVASGERTVKSGGCPGASGQDANRIAGVSGPGSQAGGATISPSELKSLTQNPRPQGVGRPCYEAANSACRGEWRRESGSPRKRAPNAGREREIGELPSPICPCPAARPGRDLLFFCVQRSASNPLTQILSRKSSCRFQSLSANLAESVFEPQHSIRKFFI